MESKNKDISIRYFYADLLYICVPKKPTNNSRTIDPLGGISTMNEKMIPEITAIIELTEEMNSVCLNDLEMFSATKVGITNKAETSNMPTALMLTTTTMAMRIVNKKFARGIFFLLN